MSLNVQEPPLKGFTTNYFIKEVTVLKILGVSIVGNEGLLYKIYSFMCIFLILIIYTALDFLEIFKYNFNDATTIILYNTAGFMVIAKALAVLWNRVKIRNVLIKLEKPPFLPDPKRGGDTEKLYINRAVWISSVQTGLYWICAAATVFGTVLYTLSARLKSNDFLDWQFPYGPFTPLNVTYSPNFEICWFYQSITVFYIAAIFTSVDVLIAAVLTHITFQFKILHNYIMRIVELTYYKMMKMGGTSVEMSDTGKTNSEVDPCVITWKYLQTSLKRIVNYHTAILEIAKEMDEVFSGLLLWTFLGTLALVCLSVYRASMVGNDPKVARYLGEIACVVTQVLLVCYWGEEVSHESQQVGWAAYNANFVGTDLRFQKGLAFIIRRSQNPTRLTAGKFSDIGIATFTWILRTSYSAFTILHKKSDN